MRIEHVGLWVRDIDRVAAFYAKYFAARVGELYQNPRKGFESRFLEFGSGARLEIMKRTGVGERATAELLGFAHVAIAVEGVHHAAQALARIDGTGRIINGQARRTLGDGHPRA